MGYAFIASVWLVPTILTGLPKYLEADVTFRPGQGNELGYLCYPVETRNKTKTMTWLTQRQIDINLFNDISLLLIMFSSILLIWYNLEKESTKAKNRQSTDLGKSLKGVEMKARKRSLYSTSAMICVPYMLLRLPIFIFGRTETTNLPVGLGACSLLYDLQFCLHFVFYAFILEDYKLAYNDLFKILLSKCKKTNDSYLVNPINKC